MSSVGVKWENGIFEVGFSASNRLEYLAHMDKIKLMADSIWPPDEREQPNTAAEQHESDATARVIENIERMMREPLSTRPSRYGDAAMRSLQERNGL